MSPRNHESRASWACGVGTVLVGLIWGVAAAWGQTATLSVTLNSALVDKPQPITGTVRITPTGSGQFDLTVDFLDNYGRTADRYQTQVAVAGVTNVPFSLASQYALTMVGQVRATGQFVGGSPVTPASAGVNIVPDPIDYDDYWCNVWGDGSSTSPSYFSALTLANADLGHIFGGNSYYGARYNLHPNNDFLEGKKWFELVNVTPTPEQCRTNYKT